MRRNTMKYGIGLAMALLVTACSNEVESDIIPEPTQPKEGNIEIILPASMLDNMQTRADDDWGKEHGEYNAEGSCTVDKGIVLVFSADIQDASNPDEWKQAAFTCETTIPVTFEKEEYTGAIEPEDNYDWKATGTFTPSSGKWYRLYAFAYNSASVYFKDNLVNELSIGTGKQLQNQHQEYTTDQLASITLQKYQKENNQPIEIFGGFLGEYQGGNYTESGTVQTIPSLAYTFTDDEAIADAYFGGNLRRKTGRLDITLTGMAEHDVASASMIIEKFIDTTPIGMEKIGASYYNPFESIGEQTVATAKTSTDGNIYLSGDMLPFESSYVDIKLTYEDGSTDTYQARCENSGEIAAGPDAIVTQIAQNSQLTLPENFWITLEGTYEQLTTGGNLSLQECWDENYEGGTLTQQGE